MTEAQDGYDAHMVAELNAPQADAPPAAAAPDEAIELQVPATPLTLEAITHQMAQMQM